MARTVLIEATPWDNAGNVSNVYLAGGGSRGYTHRGRTTWKAGIVKEPKFAAAIGFDETGWTGGSVPQTTKVQWFPADRATLTSIAAYQWKNAPITIFAGDDVPAAPAWTTIVTGTVASVKCDGGAIEFTIADLSIKLGDPFLGVARFGGTGGVDGDAAAEGRIKRRTFGKVFNVEGLVLNAAANVYEFGDPSFPLQAFAAVRDMGRDAAPAPTVLPWQGSVAATYAALAASAPAAGSAVVAPSIACVKWWTQPKGPLTADIQGEIGAGYTETVVGVAQRIASTIAGLAWTAPSAAVTAGPAGTYQAGIHAGDENESTASLLDRLLLGAGLVWILDPAGSIQVREFTFANPVETIPIIGDVTREDAYRPNTSRRVAYQRSYRIHSSGEISAAVLTTDISGLGGLAVKSVVTLGTDVVASNGTTSITDAAAMNQYVTISAGGALSGAGGGQVTPVGLSTSSGVEIRNGLISITSGSLNGIGTGTGTAVANALVTIAANGALSGAGGGQVTIGGLGFTGDLGATTGDSIFANGGLLSSAAGYTLTNFTYTAGAAGGPKAYLHSVLAVINATSAAIPPGATGLAPVTGGVRLFLSYYCRATAGVWSRIYFTGADAAANFNFLEAATWANQGTAGAWQWVDYYVDLPINTAYLSNLNVQSQAIAATGTFDVAAIRVAYTERLATKGADWTSNVVLRPSNLAALSGSEGVNNALVSIGASGALSGGGGGQVTPIGLETSSGSNIRNSLITISSGALGGIGTGTGTNVANSLVTIGANGALSGGGGGQVTLSGIDTPGVIGRTAKLSSTTGRVSDPTFYNTQLLIGPSSTTNLIPSYTVGGSNVTVNLPAHTRKIAGTSGAVTLSYGAVSGVVAFNAYWAAYIDDPNLTGFTSPTATFTSNPDDLLAPGRYQIASGVAPSSAGTGGSTGSGGGTQYVRTIDGFNNP